MENKQISSGTRFAAMFLDHLFMTIFAVLFFIPEMISSFSFDISHESTSPNFWSSGTGIIGVLGFSLYYCKDCINGRSIAKRILKLQVVDNETGQVASPMKCFVRNITIMLWPIEGIVALNNTSRRLGDRLAGTKLVVFDPSIEPPRVNIVKILIPVAVSFLSLSILILPFNVLLSSLEGSKIEYVEDSYNTKASLEIEKLFADSLGQYLIPSVRIYDRIENKPFKYVSVIFELKENYLENDQDFENLNLMALPLLFQKYPEETILGQVKYVYRTNTSMQSTTLPFNWANQK